MKTSNKELASIQLNQVIEQLKEMNISDIVNIYNDYADMNRYEIVYNNDEDTINELFDSPWSAISLSNHDGYRDYDDYFTYNGYRLMSSFNCIDDENSPIDIEELAQWLINEDKLADYDISVTTLDDMLASIGDNISDDENLLNKVLHYIHLNPITVGNEHSFDEKVNVAMEVVSSFNYEKLNDTINHLGIDYQP